MEYLQSFVDAVSEHRELRSSTFFLEFLQISSNDKWSSVKKTLDKQSSIIAVNFCIYFIGLQRKCLEETLGWG